jgi:hypothetical protein
MTKRIAEILEGINVLTDKLPIIEDKFIKKTNYGEILSISVLSVILIVLITISFIIF